MEWVGNHIEVTPIKRPKKITATRFATILGLNPWSTAFEMWCEITKTYQKPFEDTIYTIAGKTIEPKQIAYMRSAYAMDNLRTPTDIYGEDYFKKTWGDFFHDTAVVGGMWDSLLVDANGKPEAVLEFKTTKRSEDWLEDVPEYYALQASLYAYLLGVDDVIMVASFLAPSDYNNPDAFVPNAGNTITVEFKVSERYPNFGAMVGRALAWWDAHVVTGISPDFDEKKDAEILANLRTNTLTPDTDIASLLAEAEQLKADCESVYASLADKEKRLKVVVEQIKKHALGQFRASDKKVVLKGNAYEWVVSKSESAEIDKDALKADGLYDKYSRKKETFRITTNNI